MPSANWAVLYIRQTEQGTQRLQLSQSLLAVARMFLT